MIIIKYLKFYPETKTSVPATVRNAPDWYEAYLKDSETIHKDINGQVFIPRKIEVV